MADLPDPTTPKETTMADTPAQVHVVVRWNDGYLEHFDCEEVRFGCDLLWMRLTSGDNRNIPLRAVRWFSTTPESHATSRVV